MAATTVSAILLQIKGNYYVFMNILLDERKVIYSKLNVNNFQLNLLLSSCLRVYFAQIFYEYTVIDFPFPTNTH